MEWWYVNAYMYTLVGLFCHFNLLVSIPSHPSITKVYQGPMILAASGWKYKASATMINQFSPNRNSGYNYKAIPHSFVDVKFIRFQLRMITEMDTDLIKPQIFLSWPRFEPIAHDFRGWHSITYSNQLVYQIGKELKTYFFLNLVDFLKQHLFMTYRFCDIESTYLFLFLLKRYQCF